MMFGVAQKRHVFVYDHSGMELHCLKKHRDVNKLTFLPYHFLLVSAVCGDSPYPSLPSFLSLTLSLFLYPFLSLPLSLFLSLSLSLPLSPPSLSFSLSVFLKSLYLLSFSQNDHGSLRYLDTSIGREVVEHRTRMGSLRTIAQNPYNAVIHLGHQNGKCVCI